MTRMHILQTFLLFTLLSTSLSFTQAINKEAFTLAPVPLSAIVYPWPHPTWPEVHVYWNYDMVA